MEIAAFMSSLCVAVLTLCSALGVQFLFSVGLNRAYLHGRFITVLQLVRVGSRALYVLLAVGVL